MNMGWKRSLLDKRERGEGLRGKQVRVIQGPTLKLIKGHGNWRQKSVAAGAVMEGRRPPNTRKKTSLLAEETLSSSSLGQAVEAWG